jgi:hypothetical protein
MVYMLVVFVLVDVYSCVYLHMCIYGYGYDTFTSLLGMNIYSASPHVYFGHFNLCMNLYSVPSHGCLFLCLHVSVFALARTYIVVRVYMCLYV